MVKVVIIRMNEWMESLEKGRVQGLVVEVGRCVCVCGAVLIRRERFRRGGGISISQREPIN